MMDFYFFVRDRSTESIEMEFEVILNISAAGCVL